ncbi:lysophospholipid acyltransferase family protein [Vulcanococcus limneticus]|uniref:lysophospholipid acyltransferase family protein n=1 Tax=Vulcanococcus limneticus TaxID=2170428 RepID=UPI00398BEE83
MPSLPIQTAQPPLRFIPPAYTPWLRRLARWSLPLLLRLRHIHRTESRGAERLAALLADQQAGRARLLLAFRHPSTLDPLLMAQLLWCGVPRAARRAGIRLPGTVHSQFLYDRGIPLWAGPLAGWLLSHLGGIPIQRGKLDRLALKTARDLFAHGPFPLAIAPEGATNHHGELLSPLEPGLAQMAFWCCEDLAAEGRTEEEVWIVPVGLRYSLLRPRWQGIDALLVGLEEQLDLARVGGVDTSAAPATGLGDLRYRRLIAIAERLLALLEDFYQEAHGVRPERERPFLERIDRLRHAALAVAEAQFGLLAKGNLQERCRRIEQAGWERIYRADLAGLSPVARSLADWSASEAALRMGHMRLVEHFASLSGSYVAENPSPDRYAEVLQILWRAVAWIQGPGGAPLPDLGPLQACITVGPPIAVSEHFADYQHNRRRAVERLTAALGARLEASIGLAPTAADGTLPPLDEPWA